MARKRWASMWRMETSPREQYKCVIDCADEAEADAILKDREAMEALRKERDAPYVAVGSVNGRFWFWKHGAPTADSDDPADAILAAAGKERGDE